MNEEHFVGVVVFVNYREPKRPFYAIADLSGETHLAYPLRMSTNTKFPAGTFVDFKILFNPDNDGYRITQVVEVSNEDMNPADLGKLVEIYKADREKREEKWRKPRAQSRPQPRPQSQQPLDTSEEYQEHQPVLTGEDYRRKNLLENSVRL